MTSAGGANGDGVIFEYVPGSISVFSKSELQCGHDWQCAKGIIDAATQQHVVVWRHDQPVEARPPRYLVYL